VAELGLGALDGRDLAGPVVDPRRDDRDVLVVLLRLHAGALQPLHLARDAREGRDHPTEQLGLARGALLAGEDLAVDRELIVGPRREARHALLVRSARLRL